MTCWMTGSFLCAENAIKLPTNQPRKLTAVAAVI